MSTSRCGKICITPPKCSRKERRCNFYSRCSTVAAATMSCSRCVFPYMVRGVTFLSHARGIRPITTHWIAGQSEHTSLFKMMSFVNIDAFQKARSYNNVRYVENNVFFFFYLKPRKLLRYQNLTIQYLLQYLKRTKDKWSTN